MAKADERIRGCRCCRKPFTVTREWQLFCGTACRQRWNYQERGACFYCGELSDTRDHIHPVAARSSPVRTFLGQETVHACRECNTMLGANVFIGIIERIQWLGDRYRQKYKLNVGAITWDDEDIEELGRNLRRHIKKLLAVRQRAERRIYYLEAVTHELLRLGLCDVNNDPVDDNDAMPRSSGRIIEPIRAEGVEKWEDPK